MIYHQGDATRRLREEARQGLRPRGVDLLDFAARSESDALQAGTPTAAAEAWFDAELALEVYLAGDRRTIPGPIHDAEAVTAQIDALLLAQEEAWWNPRAA